MPCAEPPLLGDLVKSALEYVGISADSLGPWLSGCGCEQRRKRLNALDAWARRVVKGKVEGAVGYLRRILGEE